MLNKEVVLKIANKDGILTAKDLSLKFSVSRQYVNQLLRDLIASGKIIKIGNTRSVVYVSANYLKSHPELLPKKFNKKYLNHNLEEHKILIEVEKGFPQIKQLPENIRSIFNFSFSEMLNNAIEHSQSKTIKIEVSLEDDNLSFIVKDSGVGVFKNIMRKRLLNSEEEAVQDLLKGKTTTMPRSHSGEGIFFTSRCANIFVLNSYDYELLMTINDLVLKKVSVTKKGTAVSFSINTKSKLHLTDVFKRFTNLNTDSDYGFDKTEIRVKLFTKGDVYISRSQARRLLAGLDKFKIIVLDFEGVPVVGQAFVDEIYRVFQNSHPDIKITEENMSEGVNFMINRGKNNNI